METKQMNKTLLAMLVGSAFTGDGQEVALGLDGETKTGPEAKAGTDSVKAELSYFNTGKERATALIKLDEKRRGSEVTIKQDLAQILKSPQDSWKTYHEGFKSVLDDLRKADKPCMTVAVLSSNISRVLTAAKTQHSAVTKLVEDPKVSWKALLKQLPKTSNRGVQSTTSASVTTPDAVDVTQETNVGTLLQVGAGAFERMKAIGDKAAGTSGAFASYVGKNMGEMLEVVQADFKRIYDEHHNNGVVIDANKFMIALELREAVREPAAERKAA